MKRLPMPTEEIPADGIVSPEVLNSLLRGQVILYQAGEKAKAVIAEAEEKGQAMADRLLEEAGIEIEQRRKTMDAAVNGAKAEALAGVMGQIDRMLRGVRAALPVLVENILYRVIGAFDEQDLLARCIAMSLEEMREAASINVRVNPAEAPLLERLLAPWLRSGEDGSVRVTSDLFIEQGRAEIVSDIGTVSLSLHEQLQSFIKALEEAFADREASESSAEAEQDDNQSNDRTATGDDDDEI